jgi:hypothetical protein
VGNSVKFFDEIFVMNVENIRNKNPTRYVGTFRDLQKKIMEKKSVLGQVEKPLY